MLQTFKNGQGSIVLRVKLLDSTATTGAGKTGLTSSSSGLIISTIADNEASPTTYTQGGSTIESITTLGTYAAPTATKCRFKEVDSTNHKGIYELQIADARFAVSNAKSLLVSVSGVTGLAEADFVVQLQSDDPYVAKPANFASLSVDGSGRVDVGKVGGTAQTAGDIIGKIGTPAGASVSADIATVASYVDTEVAAIKAKTDNLPANPAAVSDIPTATQNADALLNRDMSAVSDTNARSPLNALRFLRNKWSVASSTLTVTKENDTTTAWTGTVSTSPGADPVVGNDPA